MLANDNPAVDCRQQIVGYEVRIESPSTVCLTMVFADSAVDDLMRMAEDRTAKCGALCVNQPVQKFFRGLNSIFIQPRCANLQQRMMGSQQAVGRGLLRH